MTNSESGGPATPDPSLAGAERPGTAAAESPEKIPEASTPAAQPAVSKTGTQETAAAGSKGAGVGSGSSGVLLPILKTDVEFKDGKYLVWVVTQTPSAGWNVELRPIRAEEEHERQYEIVGFPPPGPAAQSIEERTVTREEDFPPEVETVSIRGEDDLWAVDGVPARPSPEEGKETPEDNEKSEDNE